MMYSDASIHDTTECHFIIAYIAVIQLVLEEPFGSNIQRHITDLVQPGAKPLSVHD